MIEAVRYTARAAAQALIDGLNTLRAEAWAEGHEAGAYNLENEGYIKIEKLSAIRNPYRARDAK